MPALGGSFSARLAVPTVTPAVAVTSTVPVTRLPDWLCAASSTRTASVRVPPKSPVKASVSTASVAPTATAPPPVAATPLMRRFGMVVTSAKREAESPAAKSVRARETVSVAPCRLPSASAAGLVEAMDAAGPATVMRNCTEAVSPSSSSAETTTMLTTLRVGVPHTVNGAVAQVAAVPGGKSLAVQPPASVPETSSFRPAGRPATV